MKKYIMYLLILLIIFPFTINAKEVKDFKCEYAIKCVKSVDGVKYDKPHHLGFLNVEFTGYNNGDYSSGKIKYYHKSTKEGSSFKDITNSYDYFEGYDAYGGITTIPVPMKLLYKDTKDNYASLFQSSKSCPKLYCHVTNDAIIINTISNQAAITTNTIDLLGSYARSDSKEDWSSVGSFEFDPVSDTPAKEPLVCSYDVTPTGYSPYNNKTVSIESAHIELKTNYNPSTSKAASYEIKVNGSGPSIPFSTLNDTIQFDLEENGVPYLILLDTSQLKKLYTDSCPSNGSVIMYMNKDLTDDKPSYVITTDSKEAENRVLKENAKSNFENVDVDIRTEPLPCSEVLGPILSQIVKGSIVIIQIAAAIIAIVKGMMILVPAVMAHDADALKKASKTLVWMGVILALVIVFRPIVKVIGSLLEYDISCII